jgi:hypothetical protein
VIKKLKFDSIDDFKGHFVFESILISKTAKKMWEDSDVKKQILINDHGIFLENHYY